MMLEFIAPERARLDPDALHLYDDDFDSRRSRIGDHVITGATVYWDPSTAHKKSDASVCVLVYRDDKTKNIFIHDVLYLIVPDNDLHPLARQCEMVLDFMCRHCLGRIYVETNGMGVALPEIMRDVAMRQNRRIHIVPVSNHHNKETRILDSIEPILTTGRMYAHRRIQSTPLISEMIGWAPYGYVGHDDGLDAVAGAICAIPTPVRPLGQSVRPFSANTEFNV